MGGWHLAHKIQTEPTILMQLLYAAKYVLKCAVWYQFRFLIIAKTDNYS